MSNIDITAFWLGIACMAFAGAYMLLTSVDEAGGWFAWIS